MNFKFCTFLFLRTPVYSRDVNQYRDLPGLLKNSFFQMAIFAASEELYRQLEMKQFVFNDLGIKVQDSLRKYLNRMCYRPTPFGLFSTFSATTWSDIDQRLLLSGKERISIDPDFRASLALVKPLRTLLQEQATFYPNSTLYITGREFRYFQNKQDGSDAGNFIMLSFSKNKVLADLLKFCRPGRKLPAITEFLLPLFEDNHEVRDFIEELAEAEILVTDISANITGEKYPCRLNNALRHLENNEDAQGLIAWLDSVATVSNRNDPEFATLPKLASKTRASENKFNHPFYITHNREVTGGLGTKYQEQLMELLKCSDSLVSAKEPAALSAFRAAFLKKYEDREVSLLTALDPEIGVGYQKLEQLPGDDELISGLTFTPDVQQQNINWGPVQQLLMKKWIQSQSKGGCGPLEITDSDLAEIPVAQNQIYSPSFSVVFRVVNGSVIMEQAGGVTAIALTGRFTTCSERTYTHNKAVTSHEQENNQGVIFAEIAYVSNEHTDNINTREHFRDYEIPIGCHSTLPVDRQISLSDLMISISGNRLVLRSRRLNKIVVPRHSTAYNHLLSELPVFRFLCDMQYHGLKTNFTIDLASLFPGLNSYPRVVYKGNVLATAIRMVNQEQINKASTSSDPVMAWQEHFIDTGLSRYFALTIHDNQLVFDSEDRESIQFFCRTVAGKKTITLKEYIMPDQDDLVYDDEGKAYINQFVASLYNTERTYSPVIQDVIPYKKSAVQRAFLPGNEWLYFKIYCHSLSADRILTEEVTAIIKKLKKQKLITTWFFIRYYDPDHHIRFRVRINNPDNCGSIISAINQQFKALTKKGTLTNITLDSYCREIERYGLNTIEQVEQIFNRSSEIVLSFLKRANEHQDLNRLNFAVLSIDDIFSMLRISRSAGAVILENMYTGLLTEFGGGKKARVEMDSKYRKLSRDKVYFFSHRAAILDLTGKKNYEAFKTELSLLEKQIPMASQEQKESLTGDIIHMHLNRIFPTNQRKNEMVVYYLLSKHYKSMIARGNKGKYSPAA